LEKAIRFAKRNRLMVVANPSINMVRERGKELKEFVGMSNIVIMNAEEAMRFTDSRKVSTAMDKLILGHELVVVTGGKRGVVAFDGFKKYSQPAFRTRVVDSTGAGDAFTAGFLSCYLKRMPIPHCLRFGVATASMVMRDYGATNNFPSKKQIIQLMES
jgi:sugar/nucleoside kinase (ribokinase family)